MLNINAKLETKLKGSINLWGTNDHSKDLVVTDKNGKDIEYATEVK